MVNVFTVVGECRDDPWRLLVVDAEGDYYDYVPARERFTPVVRGRAWTVYRRPGDVDADADDTGTASVHESDPRAIEV